MKIQRISVHNIKGAKEIDHNLEGKHLYVIGGKNGAGKSSGGIDALLFALRGGRNLPGKPTRDGEKKGEIVVDLTGFSDITHHESLKVTRKFYASGRSELKVEDSEGYKSPSPAKLLESLCGNTTFDPLHFTRMSTHEQVDELKGLVGLTEEFEKLEKEKRKILDEKNESDAIAKSLERTLESKSYHDDAPEKPVQLKDLLDELARRNGVNQKNDKCRSEAKRIDTEISSKEESVSRINSEIKSLEEQIKALSDKRSEVESSLEKLNERKKNATEYLTTMKDENVDEISQEIQDAQATNDKVAENLAINGLKEQVAEAKKSSSELEKKAKLIRNKRKELMAKANWPVEGLSFDESKGVMLNDIPVDQLSSAEQLKVSVAIGIASAPELKTFTIKDGSLLDNETLEEIERQVKEADCQLIVEIVTRSEDDESRCAIVIEDGVEKDVARKTVAVEPEDAIASQ